MKKENTASRLSKIMTERNLRQVDILEYTKPFCIKYGVKMNKSDLSQYVSGKVEPSQEKLVILGLALNVNEAWLMGFDVPMERSENTNISKDSTQIMTFFNKLNSYGKKTATEQVRLLTLDEKYTMPDNIESVVNEPADYLIVQAAHNETKTEEELRKMENDMILLKKLSENQTG